MIGSTPGRVGKTEHFVTGIATDREQTSYCEPSEWGGTMVCERIPPSLELSSKEVP
jgi:hypothetical protein